MPSINTQLTNMINTKRTEILARGASRGRAIETAGANKIRAGKATTKFTSTAANTNAFVASLKFTGNLTNDRAAQLRYVQNLVSKFNEQMSANGYVVNDTVDGYVLAYALSYEAYFDEKEHPADIKQLRQQYRQKYLTDAYYQGLPDAEKQEVYENSAIFAMEAINHRVKARQAQSVLERNDAEESAVKFAKANLREDIDKVKGDMIIKAGKATSTFVRADKMLLASKYAAEDYSYLKKDAAYFERLLQNFDAFAKKYGARINDTADVNAVAMAINYYVYSDGKVQFNPQQFAWAQGEMRKDVLADTSYQAMTNQGKQEYYEFVAVKAMTTLEKLKDSQQFMQRISPDLRSIYKGGAGTAYDLAYRNLKSIFEPRNFDEYQLTSAGFIKTQ